MRDCAGWFRATTFCPYPADVLTYRRTAQPGSAPIAFSGYFRIFLDPPTGAMPHTPNVSCGRFHGRPRCTRKFGSTYRVLLQPVRRQPQSQRLSRLSLLVVDVSRDKLRSGDSTGSRDETRGVVFSPATIDFDQHDFAW